MGLIVLPIAEPNSLSLTPNPLLSPAKDRSIVGIEKQMAGLPHLAGDLRHIRRNAKQELTDARQAKDAAEALGRMPVDGEAFHMMISGRFALWDFIPAMLELSGSTIDALHVATLGFSKRNIAKMAELHDAAKIGTVHLLCSHYFAGTSGTIYEFAVEQFGTRPNMNFLSVRTHAKMVLASFDDGRKIVIESSANLRSCKNIEQASVFADAELYEFHRGWIEQLFAEAKLGSA